MSNPNPLDIPYWNRRWEENQVQWHLPQTNPMIVKHLGDWLKDAHSGRVFFPLCGKTKDMTHLATLGFSVFGAEAILSALEGFAEDHNGKLVEGSSKFTSPTELKVLSFEGEKEQLDVTFLYGDFFALNSKPIADGEKFNFALDRGSLVAINPSLRQQYVEIMDSVMASGARTLLIAVDYDQQSMSPPPNSLSVEETKALYHALPEGKERYSFEVLSASSEGVRFHKSNGGPCERAEEYALLITKNY